MELTHFDTAGNAVMVDVSDKGETCREAVAAGHITVSPACFAAIREADGSGVQQLSRWMGKTWVK